MGKALESAGAGEKLGAGFVLHEGPEAADTAGKVGGRGAVRVSRRTKAHPQRVSTQEDAGSCRSGQRRHGLAAT